MADEIEPVVDISVVLIVALIVIFFVLPFLLCNFFGNICPGRWVCKYLGNLIKSGVSSLIGKAIIGGLMMTCDYLPV